jgi:hypothetical protein
VGREDLLGSASSSGSCVEKTRSCSHYLWSCKVGNKDDENESTKQKRLTHRWAQHCYKYAKLPLFPVMSLSGIWVSYDFKNETSVCCLKCSCVFLDRSVFVFRKNKK